ncbi:MAG TPA: glycosyltransferase family 2 protein [Leptospiraceae bacterium]|nr:glycosyltransferase family 2 protein [Leptospiraceae bacterium]HMW08739.1 glycosyltransferase family 2 protein [Leptospiraceae bacterium]HMX33321.1 glycosyltransferase family 2 protein [Leptospiraceae bacterium]HMY32076.1 glycosyltransferase family 2 protein [Leptospiraceae bacterium]HMZ63999.1 glycosyltransferase family 2 protein [Leptospiraceae bacterium]
MTLPISVCIITLNEEDNIGRCLASLDFADEIIIVDSGSTDNTTVIARDYPKTSLYYRKFDTYINQKNYCKSLAKNQWVLALDADEEISLDLKKEILSVSKEKMNEVVGFFIPRMTLYMGKWIRHGGWYPNYQMRFFQKDKGEFSGILVHETVSIQGKVEYFKNPLSHYSYRNISDHLKFIDRYSELAAVEKFKKGKKSGLSLAIAEAIWKFISMYIIRFGFLDGKVGLIIAILGSYYNFLKYIKLYELNQKKT